MKKKIIVPIIVVVVLILVSVLIVMMSRSKGDVLYSYNSKNLTGLKTVYLDDDRMTIEFNKKYAFSEEDGYGSIQDFFDVNKDTERWIYIMLDETSITIKGEDIKSNKRRGTISFMIKNIDVERITAIRFFCYTSDTTISFPSGELTCIFVKNDVAHSGDIMYKSYTQTYDEKKQAWSAYKYDLTTTHIWT